MASVDLRSKDKGWSERSCFRCGRRRGKSMTLKESSRSAENGYDITIDRDANGRPRLSARRCDSRTPRGRGMSLKNTRCSLCNAA